ncbi:N-carbamoylputrescine amidase [Thermosynechococcaceae cyanobacterium Okahandja]
MRTLTVAAIQAKLADDLEANIEHLSELVRDAHRQGAQVILLPELFESHYFCKEERDIFFERAHPVKNHPTIAHFQALARELAVVIPVSFFEKAGTVYYNSVAIVDADGTNLGVYRKSHIPDGPGYEEKFYFRPGNTGFRVWRTRYGKLGVGICWDQWFPEAARAMTLMGAEILLYPTAIGSEPHDPTLDTKDPWQRVMVGHAVANVIPVVAANRVGNENGQVFYGSSFIADPRGDLVAVADRHSEEVLVHGFDLDTIERLRAAYGFFRDRRPGLYKVLLTADGVT